MHNPPSSSSSISDSPSAPPAQSQLAVESVAAAPVPPTIAAAKLKPKIMQIFLEDKENQKMKTVVLRSNDRVWNLMDAVGADRIRYKTRLFCGEVELTDEPGKTLQEAGVPDNSTVHYLLEALFVPPANVAVAPGADLIPCDICHASFPMSDFQSHAPCFRDTPSFSAFPQPHQPVQQPQAAAEDAIPCERCGKPISFAQYMDHANVCGFT